MTTTDSLTSALRIALLPTTSVDLYAPVLRSTLSTSGWKGELDVFGFNQYMQDINTLSSPLYTSAPDVVILQFEASDLYSHILPDLAFLDPAQVAQALAETTARITHCVRLLRQHLPSSTVMLQTVYLPPVHSLTGLESHAGLSLASLVAQHNAALYELARGTAGVLVQDVASLVADMGYRAWYDARLWYLARSRLSTKAMSALALQTVTMLRAWQGRMRKCLVLDLDNTLWGGILGEEGHAGIDLGAERRGLAFVEFQRELLALNKKGVLLAIASKNDEADALQVIRTHPNMLLREEHFAAWRIGWQDKAASLREMAAELNLGLDSFVFVDDNPVERELVRKALPEVLTPEWPKDPAAYVTAALDLAATYFLKLTLSEEDKRRSALYRAERSRRLDLQQAGTDLSGYLRGLEMQAIIASADAFSIPRIAQLTQKTNQFNLTTRRYTEVDIQRLAAGADSKVYSMSLRDRFADNGLIGVLILKQTHAHEWHIDTFLLSCRVIGRMAEHSFLACVCGALRDQGVTDITGEYIPSARNAVVADLYEKLGFQRLETSEDRVLWKQSIEHGVALDSGFIRCECRL